MLSMAFVAALIAGACTEHLRRTVERPAARVQRISPVAIAQRLVSLLNPPAILGWAEEAAVAACVRRRGLPYDVGPYVPDIRAPVTLAGRPLSVRYARRFGYGSSAAVARGVKQGTRGESLGAEMRRALEPAGAPRVRVRLPGGYVASAARHGCIAEARRTVYGSVRDFLLVTYGPQIVRLRLLAHLEEALQTPRVRQAAADYAACMARAGYRIRTPRAASRIGARRFGGDPDVSPAERRLAVADATCQEHSQVYGAISLALTDLGEDVLVRRGPFVERLVEVVRAAVSRAGRIAGWPVVLRRVPP